MGRTLIVTAALVSFGLLAPGTADADPGAALVTPAAFPNRPPPSPLATRPPGLRQGPVPVRVIDRDGFSRLSFGFAQPVPFTATQTGDVLVLLFQTRAMIAGSARLPHNVTALDDGVGRAEIHLAPGRVARAGVVGATVVVDVFDPDVSPPASQATAAAGASLPSASPLSTGAAPGQPAAGQRGGDGAA